MLATDKHAKEAKKNSLRIPISEHTHFLFSFAPILLVFFRASDFFH